jgi:hypothetical protein
MSDEGCAEKFPGFSDISKKLFGGTQFVENTVAKEIKLTVKCKRTIFSRWNVFMDIGGSTEQNDFT